MDKLLVLGPGWMRGKHLSIPPEVRSVLVCRAPEFRSSVDIIEDPTTSDARQFSSMVWLKRMRFDSPAGPVASLVPHAWTLADAIGDYIKVTRPRQAGRAYGRDFDDATLDGLQAYYFALPLDGLLAEREAQRKSKIMPLIVMEIEKRQAPPEQPRAEAPKETT